MRNLLSILGVLIALGLMILRPEPAHSSFCQICDLKHNDVAWGLRGTHLHLFHVTSLEKTPISDLLAETKLVGAHSHDWFEAREVVDPLNESGPRVIESLEFINTPRVVNFTRNVANYADPVSIAAWRELMMQPQYSYVLDASLRFMRVPEAGFEDRAEFFNWWGGNRFALYNRLRDRTEAD